MNAAAEANKHRQCHEVQAPWRTAPLALEATGCHGKAALRHLRGLAREQAALPEPEDEGAAEALAGQLVARCCWELSVALHRATGRQLRIALGADGVGRDAELLAVVAA
ncbi:unnamed protein product [Prorocentrum cordatum]|uniref:Uncharacterized protein n=2 Tax=Prorocentrum cordatum TaxID=2364126 RepID=A0ABN9TU82_9DINO|nr:unnamed protein product [Polarella glacialis]